LTIAKQIGPGCLLVGIEQQQRFQVGERLHLAITYGVSGYERGLAPGRRRRSRLFGGGISSVRALSSSPVLRAVIAPGSVCAFVPSIPLGIVSHFCYT
jgi:hypothetical protein